MARRAEADGGVQSHGTKSVGAGGAQCYKLRVGPGLRSGQSHVTESTKEREFGVELVGFENCAIPD